MSQSDHVNRKKKHQTTSTLISIGLCSSVLTYTLAILEESKCAVPRVQMHSNDGPLSKPGREVHLVSFMMQQA